MSGADVSIGDELAEGEKPVVALRGQLSIENARSQLGWEPTYGCVRDGIAQYAEHYRAFLGRRRPSLRVEPHRDVRGRDRDRDEQLLADPDRVRRLPEGGAGRPAERSETGSSSVAASARTTRSRVRVARASCSARTASRHLQARPPARSTSASGTSCCPSSRAPCRSTASCSRFTARWCAKGSTTASPTWSRASAPSVGPSTPIGVLLDLHCDLRPTRCSPPPTSSWSSRSTPRRRRAVRQPRWRRSCSTRSRARSRRRWRRSTAGWSASTPPCASRCVASSTGACTRPRRSKGSSPSRSGTASPISTRPIRVRARSLSRTATVNLPRALPSVWAAPCTRSGERLRSLRCRCTRRSKTQLHGGPRALRS